MEEENTAEALPDHMEETSDSHSGSSPASGKASPSKQITKKKPKVSGTDRKEEKKPEAVHMFSFSNMNTVSSCCALIEPFFEGGSTLYKNPYENDYLLVLHRPAEDNGYYDRAIHLVCDFGYPIHHTDALESYFREHYRILLKEDAVKALCSLA